MTKKEKKCPDCQPGRFCSDHCITPRKNVRPSWDEYFIKLADLASTRATCQRLKVGAILVKDKRIISTGYNGAPRKTADCFEAGCLMRNGHCVRTVHAELNAVLQAAYSGTSTADSTIYCNNLPCYLCTKELINAGIVRIVYRHDYRPDSDAHKLLKEAKIELIKLKEN